MIISLIGIRTKFFPYFKTNIHIAILVYITEQRVMPTQVLVGKPGWKRWNF